MRELGGATHIDELVRVYRAHNEPLHDAHRSSSPGIGGACFAALKGEGRPLGPRLGEAALDRRARLRRDRDRHLFDVVVGGDEARTQKPAPDLLLLALERLGAAPAEAVYVGDSPFDMQAATAGGLYAVGVTWGGIHNREALARRRRGRRLARGAACRPLTRRARRSSASSSRAGATSTTFSTSRRVDDATYDRHYDELVALERSIRSSSRPTRRPSVSARRRRRASRRSQHLEPMGSLEKVTTAEALAKWADDVRRAARLRRAGRLRPRAEDRRPRDQPHLRGRRPRARRHPR